MKWLTFIFTIAFAGAIISADLSQAYGTCFFAAGVFLLCLMYCVATWAENGTVIQKWEEPTIGDRYCFEPSEVVEAAEASVEDPGGEIRTLRYVRRWKV